MLNKNILKNILWLVFEKATVSIGTVVMTIYTARYLGPDKIGVYNYAISIIAIILPLSQLGNNELLFDIAAKKPVTAKKIISATQVLRLYIYLALGFSFLIFEWYFNEADDKLFVYIGLLIAYSFVALDSYRSNFDSNLKSGLNAKATFIGVLISHAVRFFLILKEASYHAFTGAYCLNFLIPFFLRKSKYKKINLPRKNLKRYLKVYCKMAFPVVISGVLTAIYVNYNQILIVRELGFSNVAIFSAGFLLANSWLLVGYSIMIPSLAVALKSKKEFQRNVSKIMLYMLIFGLLYLLVAVIIGDRIVELTFGGEFSEVNSFLPIMIITSLFSSLATISNRVILSYDGYYYLMKKSLILTIICIALSKVMIEYYGVIGVVVSMLIVEIFASTVCNYFQRENPVLKIHKNFAKQILMPWRVKRST